MPAAPVAPVLQPKSGVPGFSEPAGLEYLRMIDPTSSTEERERIKAALLAYCGQDTLAMVKIREQLLNRY
jgi:hypothetical protein